LVLRKIVRPLAIALCIITGLLLAIEYKLRNDCDRANREDITLWRMVGYSQPVQRIPHSMLSFRFYGFDGEELLRADVKLNNLGLISTSDYHKEKSAGEFRIVVLGGEQTASSVADWSWPDFLQIELSNHFPGRKISVLNFAWPDAGPEHYIEYWKNEASQYQPDLVIVNFVETDFYRTINGAELTYQGQRLIHNQEVSYNINGARAKHYVSIVRGVPGPIALVNPLVVASRPYGFILEKQFFQDPSLVKKLQETIVDQQMAGAPRTHRSFLVEHVKGAGKLNCPLVSEIRNFDPPKQNPIDRDKLVQFGVRTFGLMPKVIPGVVLLHSFNYAELNQRFELTERMMAIDPQMVVHDMRKQIPSATSDNEMRSWYLQPYMGEKWSVKGHAAYAKLVADLLIAKRLIPVMPAAPPQRTASASSQSCDRRGCVSDRMGRPLMLQAM
jgi:hypothetical protein